MCKTYAELSISNDLNNVLAAIERVISTAPRLRAQDATVTEPGTSEIVAIVDRLIRNSEKFDSQRCASNGKYARLNSLVNLISSTHKSLDNQREKLVY